jgi:tetraacyldisaccharide 4'-kinase
MLSVLLRPLALIYGIAVRFRNSRFERTGAARDVGIPVVSVGNLTVGGTGKTPFVAWLVTELAGAARHPAIVTRGYHSRAGRGPLLVSEGNGPLAPPEIVGDEPYLLARRTCGTLIIAGSDRVAAAERAVQLGADVVVMDDGFQHRRLARRLDLVLLDATSPFGNGLLLPAGSLREPLSSLARADGVVVTRSDLAETGAIAAEVHRQNPTAAVYHAASRGAGFFLADGSPASSPARAVAFCGIGNPSSFAASLRREGVEIARLVEFPDHRPYDDHDLRALSEAARAHSAALVTTEKDAVRLPITRPGSTPITVYRIETSVLEREALLAQVWSALGGSER